MNSKTLFDASLEIRFSRFLNCAQNFPNHYHEHYVIDYIEDGQRDIHFSSAAYKVNGGSFILINPFEIHQYTQSCNGVTTFSSIAIPTRVINRYIHDAQSTSKVVKFVRPIVKDQELERIFFTMQKDFINEKKSLNEQSFACLMQKILTAYCTLSEPTQLSSRVRNACAYLKKNFAVDLEINKICDLLNIKSSSLFNCFEKEVGISPHRYLMNIRIIEAKKLLEIQQNVSKIATTVGFYDHSHFTNYFKKIEGITPKEYQKCFLKQKTKPEK